MGVDAPLFIFSLIDEGYLLFLVVYFKSLDTGTLPQIWTKANVTPLFKKGNKEDPANYRPISLTCILCKVLEHIVASNLTKHFDKNNILYDLQHGFRERRSCETQLLQLTDHLARNLTEGKQTDLVLLDFSKAFDKVITLSDLECDYLNARTCCEKMNWWVLPELVPQVVLNVFLLLTGHWILFILYGTGTGWIIYRFVTKPSGNIGIYDPTEIHNRQQLKFHMKENLIKMGFHLIFFFIYLYLMIYSLIKGDDL